MVAIIHTGIGWFGGFLWKSYCEVFLAREIFRKCATSKQCEATSQFIYYHDAVVGARCMEVVRVFVKVSLGGASVSQWAILHIPQVGLEVAQVGHLAR